MSVKNYIICCIYKANKIYNRGKNAMSTEGWTRHFYVQMSTLYLLMFAMILFMGNNEWIKGTFGIRKFEFIHSAPVIILLIINWFYASKKISDERIALAFQQYDKKVSTKTAHFIYWLIILGLILPLFLFLGSKVG